MPTNSDDNLLLNFSIAATPGGIETQEAQGQRNLVQSDALPIEGNWDTLNRWGIIIQGDKIDDLFCYCTLPDGWAKVATEHSMWSSLVDSRGLIRANIFYKAAFYDRDAHVSTVKRFTIGTIYQDIDYDDELHGHHDKVLDNGLHRVVFVDTPVFSGEYKGKLVAIKGNKVYSLKGKILQVVDSWELADVVLLTNKQFYDKWHNTKVTQYDFLDAIEKLAAVKCQKYIGILPTDDSIWGSEFDFPEVAQK